ncbi:MAG TPA: SWIM zinc finger family protein [Thermomicrobiales bacterium]|jgi:hypothetical protein|nr:SWIM zinc finger family protein [Thermomicrobiales bacterium]
MLRLTAEQVLALAPDGAAAAAGRKLGAATPWRDLGCNDAALWGECQGSALYQVRVDLADLAVKCSCPSRKVPCKHSLGLLLLAATTPGAFAGSEPPEWVSDWLARRASNAARREAAPAKSAPDAQVAKPAAKARQADRRLARVTAGLDALDLWLHDLLRTGLASVEMQPASFWEQQAARLVDAQAPGVAARVRQLATIPNSAPDWPARLLDRLGRLALLLAAFRQLDDLPADLREDVRGAIGWTLNQEEVIARGETVTGEWLVLGQRVTEEDRLRAQRTWLASAHDGRPALIMQYAIGSAPFPNMLLPGTRLSADLTYWPGAAPQRALVRQRHGGPEPIKAPLPGAPNLAALLDQVAAATARQPWLDRFLGVLNAVLPARTESGWFVHDHTGNVLPLAAGDHWRLLALSGGQPVDLAAEWDGETLAPLGVLADSAYFPLTEAG